MTYEYAPGPNTRISSAEVANPQQSNQATASSSKGRFNTLAVVSFALSLISALGIPAIIIGHFAMSDIKKTGERGRVLAILGLIFGYLQLIAAIAFTVLFFAVFVERLRHSGGDNEFWQQQFQQFDMNQGINS